MKSHRLKSEIEGRQEELIQPLFKLLKQKSISAQNIGIVECANLLKKMMEGVGVENVRSIETDGHPVVYGEIIRDPNAFTLIIYGHYDVQPPDPIEDWKSPPFEPTIRNGKIYCRGVGDNKGQLVAHLMAIKIYLEHHESLPINIKFIFEGEEEIGSKNLSSFVKNNKELLKADLVYTADGAMHESGAPYFALGVRGMLYIEMIAKGAKWDNHSGDKGNIVPNPAWEMVSLLSSMKDNNGNVIIKGFYDNVKHPTKLEKEVIKKMPFDKSLMAKATGYDKLDMDGEAFYRKLTMEPTFNIAGFTSGYGGEGSKTIIPSIAMLKMDIRLVADQDPEDIFDKVCAHVKEHSPDVEVKCLNATPPSRTSMENEAVKVLMKAVTNSYEKTPVVLPSFGGTLPEYVWTKILGVPSITVPYANYDERNHSPNENMDIKNYLDGIRCTYNVIQHLGISYHN